MRRASAAALAMLLAGLVAGPAEARDSTISMRENLFQPHFLVILVGDTVTWRNDGEAEHTVQSFPDAPMVFSSGSSRQCVPTPFLGPDPDDCMEPGDTFGPVTFDRPGTYDYFCSVHGNTSARPDPNGSAGDQPCGMCGQIIVKREDPAPPGGGSPSPTGTPSSPTPTVSPSVSASPSESPSPSVDGDGGTGNGPIAAGDGAGGGGPGRGAIALLMIMVLTGAGYVTWRRYLARQ